MPRVAVVGAGPAGLIAAEVLASAGAAVTLVDRMPSPGRKLLLAGRGGLNLTHAEPLERFIARYGDAGPTLRRAIEAYPPDELRRWADGLGERTFVGSSGRVFPASFRATPLLRAWLRRLDALGVERLAGVRWEGWTDDGALRFQGGADLCADATVLALGGASWPRAGSDGTWVEILRAAGVAVTALAPANCGFDVAWSPTFRERFSGVPLKNVAVTFGGTSVRGDAMVTTAGIEGGPVYALSSELRRAGEGAVLHVDLLPDREAAQVKDRLTRRRRNSVATMLAKAGVHPVAAGLLREATGNRLPSDPGELAALVKRAPVRVLGPRPIARAISSAGGVSLEEVDERFMLRRRPGTFVAGEMLDWEAPTGGYLLQGTFSTGVAAARGALAWMSRP